MLLTIVPPAVRVLSPAWAPRGLHRALFMNSVSHGKIWTENAASPLNKPVLLRRACLGVIYPRIHPSPPPPPPPPSNCQLEPIAFCLRVGQFGGEGVGGVTQNRTGRVYFVTCPHPLTKPLVQIQVGPWPERLLQSLSHVPEIQVSMSAF